MGRQEGGGVYFIETASGGVVEIEFPPTESAPSGTRLNHARSFGQFHDAAALNRSRDSEVNEPGWLSPSMSSLANNPLTIRPDLAIGRDKTRCTSRGREDEPKETMFCSSSSVAWYTSATPSHFSGFRQPLGPCITTGSVILPVGRQQYT